MEPAVLTFDFDPILSVGGFSARVETVAVAAVLFVGLMLAARIGALTPMVSPLVPPPTLGARDLPILAVGIVPGAVIGGRLEYVLVHLDFYTANPGAVIDPAQGGLGLGLAVFGGMASGALAGRALGLQVGPWAHALALPTLFVLAAAKLVGILGATGQGAPADVPWATAYAGAGPWGSLHPEIASHPAQVYEALGGLAVVLVLGVLLRGGAFARADGSALLAGVAGWSVARFLVAFSWRDDPVVGPLAVAQVVAFVVILACLIGLVRVRRAATRRRLQSLGGGIAD